MPSHRVVMVAVVLSLAGASFLAGTPVYVTSTPICFRCGREITRAKLAAEIIAPQGVAYRFRTVFCLAQYLAGADERDQPPAEAIYVTDWPSGQLVRAERAHFVEATIDYRTRERDYFAFRSAEQALKFAEQRASSVVDWPTIRRLAAAAITN